MLCSQSRGKGRQKEGGEAPSQEALRTRPSMDPQPQVTELLRSASLTQPPCEGYRPATGSSRRKEGEEEEEAPPVSCVINI